MNGHDHASMLAAAGRIAVVAATEARSAEVARQPSDAVIQTARDEGIFEMMVPAGYGSAELDLDTFFETTLILGGADASAAWIIAFYIEHNWMLCQFDEVFQKELYADRTYVLAPAMLSPAGSARRVDGGYRLDGRWQWGTGLAPGPWCRRRAQQVESTLLTIVTVRRASRRRRSGLMVRASYAPGGERTLGTAHPAAPAAAAERP